MAKQQQQQQQQQKGNRSSSQTSSGSQEGAKTSTGGQGNPDAISLLKSDHRKVEGLFQQYESATSSEAKSSLAQQICNELIIHTKVEEEMFYPACREKNVQHDLLDEAQVEHDAAKVLVTELMTMPVSSEYYDAKVSVLSEYIKHHVGEEERPSTGLFASAQTAGLDVNALGPRLQARKQELMTKAETEGFSPPRPRSLGSRSVSLYQQEDQSMARYERERDDQGRFMSDGDDYGRSSRGGYSGSGNYRERDDQGRFMSEDDDGERGGRSYGRSERGGGGGGRGQGGWFGDSEGHSEASRQGWDERGGSRYSRGGGRGEDEERGGSRGGGGGRGQGGWFGDQEGHSEASRQGWEERGGGRYSRGGGRGYDEDEERGGSRGGGGGDRGRGHGGWFGDSQGHSEASRQGWEERGGGRSSRGGGGRGGYEEDDRSDRSRSGGNADHRGWYGDSRGHSEAARRGWQNR